MLCSEAAICSPSLTAICSWTKKIYGIYGSIPAVREIQPNAHSEKWTEGSSVASIPSQGRNFPRRKLDKIPLKRRRSNFWLRGFVWLVGWFKVSCIWKHPSENLLLMMETGYWMKRTIQMTDKEHAENSTCVGYWVQLKHRPCAPVVSPLPLPTSCAKAAKQQLKWLSRKGVFHVRLHAEQIAKFTLIF